VELQLEPIYQQTPKHIAELRFRSPSRVLRGGLDVEALAAPSYPVGLALDQVHIVQAPRHTNQVTQTTVADYAAAERRRGGCLVRVVLGIDPMAASTDAAAR
jgi:hypothetical protein